MRSHGPKGHVGEQHIRSLSSSYLSLQARTNHPFHYADSKQSQGLPTGCVARERSLLSTSWPFSPQYSFCRYNAAIDVFLLLAVSQWYFDGKAEGEPWDATNHNL